jgi:hypothetical protein
LALNWVRGRPKATVSNFHFFTIPRLQQHQEPYLTPNCKPCSKSGCLAGQSNKKASSGSSFINIDLLATSFAVLNRTNPCEIIDQGDDIFSLRCDIRYNNVWYLNGDDQETSELYFYPEEYNVDYDWYFLDTESYDEYIALRTTNATAAQNFDIYINEDCYCDDIDYGDADEIFYRGPECSVMCYDTYMAGAATLAFIPVTPVPKKTNSTTKAPVPPSPNSYYLDRYVSYIDPIFFSRPYASRITHLSSISFFLFP